MDFRAGHDAVEKTKSLRFQIAVNCSLVVQLVDRHLTDYTKPVSSKRVKEGNAFKLSFT